MKKLVIAAGLVAMTALSASAQRPGMDNKTPEERATAQSKQLTKKLALNSDQEKKVYDISYARAKKMEELRGSSGDRQQKMQQSREIMENSDKEIDAVLNADQKKNYAAWKSEARERAGKMRRDGGRPMKRDSSATN